MDYTISCKEQSLLPMHIENYIPFFRHNPVMRSHISGRPQRSSFMGGSVNRPVSIGLLPIYSTDPSQHNDTSVRSSVRTTEGLDSHGSGSNRTSECIPGRPERLPVPRGVEGKCGEQHIFEI